ncbi:MULTISPECIES: hypothetical protein [unclassified Roseateles]|uniref:hypothetical protein n=1 Tax=unclassified Roseateles TaxID=2626991 RepID=UPI00071387E4|nr:MULTISPECIES: hypothetical protein [unclassified Roseateles]KQW43482.1 hypothetical protein ASC81_17060 [Pelomonas sp. Root405]KRA71220.1 hypothetical protein ASD88_15580 [Pelomonas sp. Root662]
MSIHRTGLSAVSVACVLALSACGGGGGGDNSPAVPSESTMLGLNASNYQAVAQSTVSSALFLNGASGLAGGDARLLSLAASTSRRALSAGSGQAGSLKPLAVLNETLPCSQGGNLAFSFNDANNNGNFDVGDVITLDAQSCKEDGAVMQGRLALGVQALNGVYDSNNFSATLTMTLTGFGVTSDSDVAQADGSLTLTVSQTPAGVGELTLATPRLTLGGRIEGKVFSTALTDTRLSLRTETIGGTLRTSVAYTSSLSSSQFGDKVVTVTTPQPMVITGSDSYPSSGQMVVRGHANSVLRITALNVTQARLELDAEGDGSYETQTLKTWAELE